MRQRTSTLNVPQATPESHQETHSAQIAQVCGELLEYVKERHAFSFSEELTSDTPLLVVGLIDSLSMMTFILHLEQRYGLDFMAIDITRSEFASIATLAGFVVANQETS